MSKKNEEYNIEEAGRRFDAALRGAFATPPKPMKDIPRQRKGVPTKKSQRKRKISD